jgi:hypothetical protein
MPNIYDWPVALRPESVDFALVVPQVGNRSVTDPSLQTLGISFPRWRVTMSTGAMSASEAPKWEAFINRLRGRIHRARFWDWRREAPLGVGTGSPTVRLTASGDTVALQGFTVSTTGILLAGSWLGINGELKQLSADINSDSLGRATASFEPPLRATAPAGGAVVLVKPTALFVLDTESPGWEQSGSRYPAKTLAFSEVPA